MKFSSIPTFVKKNGVIIFILLLAAFLRLYKIEDYMTFLGDQGRDVLTVYGILHGKLTLLGPTSSVGGFFLGPIYYYFMAPFLWLFNYNPVGPAVMVALIGIATVFLIYYFCTKLFDKKVGLIAALLYAVSPVVISYSRTSWNPNPLPFFSLLSLYILYKAILKNSLKLFFLSGILLGIAMQLHYLATFLAAVMFFYILFTQGFEKVNLSKKFLHLFKKYIVLFIGFLIGWSPFLAFELRHGFPDFKNIFNFLVHSENTGASSSYFFTIYDVFFRIFGRLILNFPDIGQISKFSKFTLNIWAFLILIIGFFAVVILIKKLLDSYRQKKNYLQYLLLFLWFFVGILLFGFYKKSIYDYYFSFMFPLPFILVGILFSFVWNKNKIYFKTAVLVFVSFLFIINIEGLPFKYPPNRQLNQMKTIADFVMTKTNAKPFNFALIADGNTDHAYRYFFTVWNHPPKTIDYPGVDPKRNSVADQLLVVCESPLPCYPLGNSLWEIAGFGQADIAGYWKVSVVEVYKLVHHKGK